MRGIDGTRTRASRSPLRSAPIGGSKVTSAARPHVLNFEDTDADDLYDILAREAACLGAWDYFAPAGNANVGGTRSLTRLAAATCFEKCPVFNQCARLAEIVQPDAGVWAGRLHTPQHPEGVAL